MRAQSVVPQKKRRGPEPTGKGTSINLRLQPRDLAALDAYSASLDDPATRPQAIRYILTDWLIGHGFLKHREDPEGAN